MFVNCILKLKRMITFVAIDSGSKNKSLWEFYVPTTAFLNPLNSSTYIHVHCQVFLFMHAVECAGVYDR